jgi:hypothetical protein
MVDYEPHPEWQSLTGPPAGAGVWVWSENVQSQIELFWWFETTERFWRSSWTSKSHDDDKDSLKEDAHSSLFIFSKSEERGI